MGNDAVITKKVDYLKKIHLIKPGIIFYKNFGPRYDIYLKDIKNYG